MWPCAIGSREETAKGACYIHAKSHSWFLCRVILNGARFFAGRRPPFVGAPQEAIRPGLPLSGDRKAVPWAPLARSKQRRSTHGPPGLGVIRARSIQRGAMPATADISPARPLPLVRARFCFPWGRVRLAFSISPNAVRSFSARVRDRSEPRANCPPRVLSRNLWRCRGSRQPAPDNGPCPRGNLQGAHPPRDGSPHVGPNHLRSIGPRCRKRSRATDLRARAFELGGPRAGWTLQAPL